MSAPAVFLGQKVFVCVCLYTDTQVGKKKKKPLESLEVPREGLGGGMFHPPPQAWKTGEGGIRPI